MVSRILNIIKTIFLSVKKSLLSILFIGPLVTTLVMIAKLSITSSYGAIYIFTAEQFPTVVRNVGLGASSTVGMFY